MLEKYTFFVKIFVKYKSMVLANGLFKNVIGSKIVLIF
jgi:hypothetical protein